MAVTTVLEILSLGCQQIGIRAPANFTATDTNSLQLYALFKDVHFYLRNQRIWPQMKSTHEIELENNRQFYPLPQNFFAALLGTQYDETTKFPLIGPLSDAQFAARQYGLAGFAPSPSYRVFGPDSNPNSAGGQFEIWPVPNSVSPGDKLVFEYQWRNMFLPPNWTPSTSYTNGAYVNANGNIYIVTTSGTSGTTAPTGRSTTPQTNGTAAFAYSPAAYETIITANDLSAFDPELVIVGFKAWYYESKGQPQAQVSFQQFNKMIESAKNRFKGSFRGSMSRYRNAVTGISPQGGWNL